MNNSQLIAGDIECSDINPTLSVAFNKAVSTIHMNYLAKVKFVQVFTIYEKYIINHYNLVYSHLI